MGFIIIFRDQDTKTIAARYYGSKFRCYSNGKALKPSSDKASEELDKKLIHVA